MGFLNTYKNRDQGTRAKLLWSLQYKTENNIKLTDSNWSDLSIEIDSPESEFCTIRGQGEKDKPLLERISGNLITATECSGRRYNLQKRKGP